MMQTRKHSSRMRTVRFLRGGGAHRGVYVRVCVCVFVRVCVCRLGEGVCAQPQDPKETVC